MEPGEKEEREGQGIVGGGERETETGRWSEAEEKGEVQADYLAVYFPVC